MQLVMRCDDFGYSPVFNLGLKKVLEEGICTHVELMTDTPGNIDAMKLLKEHPYLSVGWHMHWRGKPVLPAEEVPSLVTADGRFKWGVKPYGVWIIDPELKPKDDPYAGVKKEEVKKELRAELALCLQYMGRVVDLTNINPVSNPVNDATAEICEEYGIAVNCYHRVSPSGSVSETTGQFKEVKLTMVCQPAHPVYLTRTSEDSYIRNCTYDPLGYMLRDEQNVLGYEQGMMAWHPGFIDDYFFMDGSYFLNGDQKFFEPSPLVDVAALCAPELKQWVKDNKVELVTVTDAVYGTRNYQNHLRAIGSELFYDSF